MAFTFPTSTIPPLDQAPALRWGILATGWIASQFAESLHRHSGQIVAAVASRDADRAEQFARQHGIPAYYPSYEALVAASDIDVVYVAAPHSEHARLALLAIEAGKPVLVEKPFTTTADEARLVVEAARRNQVFAMEAMWTRYLPQSDVARQLLAAGALGGIQLVLADHGQLLPRDGRLFKPELGGGALLDLGIYPISFASAFLGAPRTVQVLGSMSDGVDAQCTITLGYGQAGVQAELSTSVLAKTPNRAAIAGTHGLLEFGSPFFAPTTLSYSDIGLESEPTSRPVDRDTPMHEALCYQAVALARYLDEGRSESPLHPLDEVIAIMQTVDDARHQLGYRLPWEQ
jgi:predicted dehydrogenase